ncbi:MAG: PAS domain S-box protein [Methylotetracoccus sp.]
MPPTTHVDQDEANAATALLYRLALAAGQTVDPADACRNLARELIEHAGFSSVAVWWLTEAQPGTPARPRLLHRTPEILGAPTDASLDAPWWHLGQQRGVQVYPIDAGEFPGLTEAEPIEWGHCALLPLDGRGVLKLRGCCHWIRDPDFLHALQKIAGNLATTIQNGRTCARLRAEIEEHRRAQSLLAVTVEELEAIAKAQPDVLCKLDRRGRMTWANHQACLVTGKSEPELLSMPVLEHFSPAHHERVSMAIATAFGTGRAEIEVPLRTAHGERMYHYRGVRVQLDDRREPFLVVTGRDIHERVAAQRALSESHTLLRTIIENLPTRVFWKDVDFRYLGCNQLFAHDAGRQDPTQIVGRHDSDLSWRDHADRYQCDDRQVIESGIAKLAYEEPQTSPTGETLWLRTSKVPLRNADGDMLGVLGMYEDITDRKRAEEALLRSETLLRATLDSTADGILVIGANGAVLELNHRFLELWRIPAGSAKSGCDETLLACAMDQLADPDGFMKLVREIYATDQTRFDTFAFKDGRVFERYTRPLSIDGERARLWSFRDVTDVKASEAALQTSEERLRLALNATDDGVWDWDLRTGKAFLTPRCYEMTGLDPGAAQPDLDFLKRTVHREDLPRITTIIESHLQGATRLSDFEYRVTTPRGDVRWMRAKGRVVERDPHGSPLRMVGTVSDISERKRNEAELDRYRHHLEELVAQRTAELMRTEAKATHILQSSADGLYGIDTEGRATFINRAACRILGYSPVEVIGRSVHALFHHSHADGTAYPIEECPSHHAISDGGSFRVDDEVYWHADGHPIPVMYSVHPMLHDGRITGAVVSFVDVSVQRAAQEARERALIAAENLARTRSAFLANMSHEIRTPLNGVLGFAQLGLRKASQAEKAREAFERIIASGTVLLGVINDILDFSKIDAGKFTIEQTTIDLNALIDQNVDMVRDRARAKGLVIHVRKSARLPARCLGDPLRIGQILLNLLSNALKFTESGSITLTADLERGMLLFRIADTGIGMTREQTGRLFTPFEQADGSSTRRFGGTGLGLAIAKRIAELMRGDILVESAVGIGSTFEVRLPYAPSAIDPEGHASDDPAFGAAQGDSMSLLGRSILVAEDNPINQTVLSEVLAEAGAKVILVADGQQAVRRIAELGADAFDLVLMDVQMPEMDGYEATRRIRKIAPDLPIIGQTAHAYDEERQRCLAAGMVAHIAKPFAPDDLVKQILEHLRPRGET